MLLGQYRRDICYLLVEVLRTRGVLLLVKRIAGEDVAANRIFFVDLQTQEFFEAELSLHDPGLCVKSLRDMRSRCEGALNRNSEDDDQKGGPHQSPRHVQE